MRTKGLAARRIRSPGALEARRGRTSAARDIGANTTRAGNGPGSGAGWRGSTGGRSTVRRQVAWCRRSQTSAMLCRRGSGWGSSGYGTCGRRGEAGAETWQGAERRTDSSDVCVVMRTVRSSTRSADLSVLGKRRGVPRGEEVYHMPSMLNPSWDAGPGRGTAGRWLVRNTVAEAVWMSRAVTRCGEWPAVAASTGG